MNGLGSYVIGAVGGFVLGWIVAHGVVGRECERLGGFYVGGKTFKCVEVKEFSK